MSSLGMYIPVKSRLCNRFAAGEGWMWNFRYCYWLDFQPDMVFLILLLVGFHWEINAKAGHGISGNAPGWISLGNNLHG
jgi:hypothetical protein